MPDLALQPILDQRRLSDQVYSEILKAIVEQRTKPGERLVLDEIATQLQVSPTPVRDALCRLAAEGLVQPTGRRGYCVTQMSVEELAELYDLRLMCESYAVEKGMDNLTPETLDRMEELAKECARLATSGSPSDRLLIAYQDREFHRLIIGLAGNQKLSELFDRLRLHIHAARLGVGPTNPIDARRIYQSQHFRIVAALRSGDLSEVKSEIRQHIEQAHARVATMLAAQPSSVAALQSMPDQSV